MVDLNLSPTNEPESQEATRNVENDNEIASKTKIQNAPEKWNAPSASKECHTSFQRISYDAAENVCYFEDFIQND